MAFGTQRIALFAITGITIAAIIFASIYWAPMLFPGAQAKTGTLLVKVTDAPAPDLRDLNLTVTSLQVLNKSSDAWIPLTIEGGQAYFDLLKLQNITRDLGLVRLEPGNYTKIRLGIAEANCTLDDGTTMELEVPPGHLDIQAQFEIKANSTTVVIIDIEVDRIHIATRGKSGQPANLNPQIKALVIPP